MLLGLIVAASGCRSDGPSPGPIRYLGPAGELSSRTAGTANATAASDPRAGDPRAAEHASLLARALKSETEAAQSASAIAAGSPALSPVLQVGGGQTALGQLVAQSGPLPAAPEGNVIATAVAVQDVPGERPNLLGETRNMESGGEGTQATLPPPVVAEPQRTAAPQADLVEELPAPAGRRLLELETVLISTTESFPSVREAAQLLAEALGISQQALGEFDDRLDAFTINQPMSFYQNYRHGISWSRPLENGGVAYTGYRIGRGRFEPWYGGRDTDDSGEFRVGFEIPLLQNRAIDPRRTAVALAALDIQSSNPELFQQVLGAQTQAAEAYWQWVSVGQQYEVAEELMRLAEERVERIQRLIDAEDIAEIVGIDNRRLLAQRRSRLIEARQRWDAAAVRLSLYYRDTAGLPISVPDALLPEVFPEAPSPPVNLETDIAEAMNLRPELAILRIAGEQLRTELRLAINQQLPEVGFSTEASKDVGPLSSPLGDKRPFVLETGLIGSVPVQRNRAIGRARSLRARLAQLDARTQLTADQIANEIRQATIAYQAARQRLQQATLGKELARETLRVGEIAFLAGEIDILLLNIYEQAYADAGLEVIDAQAAMHIALAQRMTARGEMLLDESDVSVGRARHSP